MLSVKIKNDPMLLLLLLLLLLLQLIKMCDFV